MTSPKTLTLHANGLRFTARAMGEGPLLLCLHGFPDSAHTWDDLLPVFADAGYRAVAPFMRGYASTEVPADGDYSVATLGLDVLGIADALGAMQFKIIGHDWGAVTAYSAASYAPERIPAMVTASVPPLRRFLLNMRPPQMRRSWYIGFFQLPWLPEYIMRKNDCEFIDKLWQAWSPQWEYSAADIAPVKSILARPDSCRAALGYYRGLPWPLIGPRRGRERKRALGNIDVRTLVINGEQDGAMGPEQFTGTRDCFNPKGELLEMCAGHFMHREQPQAFAEKALDFLAQ